MARSRRGSARAAKAETEAAEVPKSGDRLLGAVWQGRMFDHTKAADQAAFKALVKADKAKPDTDKKTGLPTAKLDLQRLADEGVIRGFGTTAKKAKKAKKGEEDEGSDADTGAAIGGGVEGSEEPGSEEEEE